MSTLPPSFSNFQKLSPNVLISSPPKLASEDASAPDLIIISAWMGAALKHIAKYTVSYSTLYPTARVVVITNLPPDMMYRSSSTQQKRLEPVIAAIRSATDSSPTGKPKILLHAFSNGGSNQANQLALAYRTRYSSPLPIGAMILDSAPGKGDYWGGVKAFAASLPKNPILRWIGLALVHALISGYFLLNWIFRVRDPIELVRRRLLDQSLFSVEANRTYAYSEGDELVGWQDVERHADEAKAKGWVVKKEEFVGSKHVGHVVVDGERYWNVVRGTWEGSRG